MKGITIVSRILRTIVAALAAMALLGVAASAASAVEAPFYKVGGKRLGAAETKEPKLTAEGNQILSTATITITCTGIAAGKGTLITGSAAGEPGTSSGTLEYSGCTVTGNGTKCAVAGKKVVTNALKDELVYALKQEPLVKGNKIEDLFTPASGAVFATVKFEAEAGGTCTNKETAVEGSVVVEVLNKVKAVVAFEENEKEEAFGFIKAIPGGEACKVKASKFTECKKASIKAFGIAAKYEGTSKVELSTKEAFGVFSK